MRFLRLEVRREFPFTPAGNAPFRDFFIVLRILYNFTVLRRLHRDKYIAFTLPRLYNFDKTELLYTIYCVQRHK